MSVHGVSAVARNVDVRSQPWFCADWTADKATAFLKDKPRGSFVLRAAPDRPKDFVLTVQADGRTFNVLVRHIEKNGIVYWGVNPSTHFFQSLVDLLQFCSKSPFTFKGVEVCP